VPISAFSPKGTMNRNDGVARLLQSVIAFECADVTMTKGPHAEEGAVCERGHEEMPDRRRVGDCSNPGWCVENDDAVAIKHQMASRDIDNDPIRRVGKVNTCLANPRRRAVRPVGKRTSRSPDRIATTGKNSGEHATSVLSPSLLDRRAKQMREWSRSTRQRDRPR